MVATTLTTENHCMTFPNEGWLEISLPGAEETVFHQPVLVTEVLQQLRVGPGGVFVDATVGEGGHAGAVLRESAPDGRVLGIDRDPRSLARAYENLEGFGNRFIPRQGNYADLEAIAAESAINAVDGILLDVGLSSRQLEAPGYGFSFQVDEPLDMRFDPESPLSADELVNTYSEQQLAGIIFEYGEEPRARRIAQAIVRNRPIHASSQLARIVAGALAPFPRHSRAGGKPGRGQGANKRQRTHPATKTFQAIRIAVNDELHHIGQGLSAAVRLLSTGGRLAVISYHSLEDRIVKQTLAREASPCICPPGLPVCVCGHEPSVKLVNRKIMRPSPEEVESNPRSRSARMRVAERLAPETGGSATPKRPGRQINPN